MTFHEQPTTLFVPLECRYVTAASAAALQLQPDARATEIPESMRASKTGKRREMLKHGEKQQAIKLEMKGKQVLIMEARKETVG